MWEDASTPGPSISERGGSSRYPDNGRKGTREKEEKRKKKRMPGLRAFELPFVYEEVGQRKEALVKVRLCAKCQAKLVWKPGKEEPASDEEEEERRDGHPRGDTRREDNERYRREIGKDVETRYSNDDTKRRRPRKSTSGSENDEPGDSSRQSAAFRRRARSHSRSPVRRREESDDIPRRRNLV
jgi:protein FRA10AC1